MPEKEQEMVTVTNRLADVEAQEEEQTEEKKWRDMERTLMTRVVQGTAGASIVLNIAAMAVAGGIAILMGIVAILVASAVIYFQFMIQDTDTLRKVQNDLRHSVNDFAKENVQLSQSNTELETQLVPLKETEARLQVIAQKSGSNTEALCQIVKENQKTLNAMKETLREDIIQSMMEVVMVADRDENGTFDDVELRRLLLRLKGLPAIQVNEEKFMMRTQLHRSISDVFCVVKTIYEDLPEDERIFTINESRPSVRV